MDPFVDAFLNLNFADLDFSVPIPITQSTNFPEFYGGDNNESVMNQNFESNQIALESKEESHILFPTIQHEKFARDVFKESATDTKAYRHLGSTFSILNVKPEQVPFTARTLQNFQEWYVRHGDTIPYQVCFMGNNVQSQSQHNQDLERVSKEIAKKIVHWHEMQKLRL